MDGNAEVDKNVFAFGDGVVLIGAQVQPFAGMGLLDRTGVLRVVFDNDFGH